LRTNQSSKNDSALPKRSAAQPHSRRPLTSEFGQSKPVIGVILVSVQRVTVLA
jgi:hypothetical protein